MLPALACVHDRSACSRTLSQSAATLPGVVLTAQFGGEPPPPPVAPSPFLSLVQVPQQLSTSDRRARDATAP
jgi:hypothetical protein